MNELAYLLCDIVEKGDRETKLRSWLEDETPFEFAVPHHMVREIENSAPKRGWCEITYSGEKDRRASITLPRPAFQFGSKMTVSTKHLDRPATKKKD